METLNAGERQAEERQNNLLILLICDCWIPYTAYQAARKIPHPPRKNVTETVAGFIDNGEGVRNTPSDSSGKSSRRDHSKAIVFFACVPQGLEMFISEIRPGGGCVILTIVCFFDSRRNNFFCTSRTHGVCKQIRTVILSPPPIFRNLRPWENRKTTFPWPNSHGTAAIRWSKLGVSTRA